MKYRFNLFCAYILFFNYLHEGGGFATYLYMVYFQLMILQDPLLLLNSSGAHDVPVVGRGFDPRDLF